MSDEQITDQITEETEQSAPAPKLNLAAGRVIPLREGDALFTLTCRRVTKDDWLKYFSAASYRSSVDSEGRTNEVDTDTPRIMLADAVLVDAAGYKVAGDVELKSLPDWKRLIPLRHRLELGRVLTSARISRQEQEDVVIHPEGEEVRIDAPWTAGDDGKLLGFTGLKHVLAMPTESQFKRYSADASRSTVVGGSRSGTTIYRSSAPILAALYDEMVISVDEMYVVDGKPLLTKEDIVREMDFQHKVGAAESLFVPSRRVSVEGAVD